MAMMMMAMTKVVESGEIGTSFERERVEWSAWSDDDDDDGDDDVDVDGDGDDGDDHDYDDGDGDDESCDIANTFLDDSKWYSVGHLTRYVRTTNLGDGQRKQGIKH